MRTTHAISSDLTATALIDSSRRSEMERGASNTRCHIILGPLEKSEPLILLQTACGLACIPKSHPSKLSHSSSTETLNLDDRKLHRRDYEEHFLMVKERGKKFKRKNKKIGQSNVKMKKVKISTVNPTEATVPPPPAPPTDANVASASGPKRNSHEGSSQGKEKAKEKAMHLSGFIFMCNSKTKLECYQYRVFGLPSCKEEVVEQIKPGAKLFLFDFELKLLYGVYEATSAGKLNLEPAAFKGKFPAQVKFRIFKECLPLPESSLRTVIKENYTGLKFKQDLGGKQVKKLLSAFWPLNASLSQPAPKAVAKASLSRAMLPSAMENQFNHPGRLPALEVPYLAGKQCRHIPPLTEPLPVPHVNPLCHGYHRAPAYAEHVNLTSDHQSLLATRYRTLEGTAPHDQVTNLALRYLELPSRREVIYQGDAAAYTPTLAAPGQHTSSITQPFQSEALHWHSVVAYNSYSGGSAQCASSVLQPRVPAGGKSQGSGPISYYLYTLGNRLGH